MKPTSVLFICLGNICRSPAAEAVFASIVEKNNAQQYFRIDSAGLISYHEGEPADSRMRNIAYQRGYRLTHISRPIRTADFYNFDLIIGMDHENIKKLNQLCPPDATASIELLTRYCTSHPDDDVVPDPYYSGTAGFVHVIDLLEDACKNLFQQLAANKEFTI